MFAPLERLLQLWSQFHKSQNRSTVWGVKFGALFVVFLIFYVPSHRQVDALSKTLSARHKEMASAERRGLTELPAQQLEAVANILKEYEGGFLDVAQADTVVNIVSEAAAKNNFSITKITSDNVVGMVDETGKEIERNGKKIKRIPIHVRFATSYKNIASFLQTLPPSPKRLWVIESLQIDKTSTSDDLQCEMAISFFAW